MTESTSGASPLTELSDYIAFPRLSGLTISPDGARLVTEVAVPQADGTAYTTHLWEIDPHGERPARQLTRGTESETSPAFSGDGTLWFLSKRPGDPTEATEAAPSEGTGQTTEGTGDVSLWCLPALSGEAQRMGRWPGGISAAVTSTGTSRVLATAAMLPAAQTAAEHARLHRDRTARHVTGVLHDTTSLRFWDHDLGPARPQLFALDPDTSPGAAPQAATLRPLTQDSEVEFSGEAVLNPEGSTALITVIIREACGDERRALASVEVSSGAVTLIDDDVESRWSLGPISGDGRRAAVVRGLRGTSETAGRPVLEVLDLTSGTLHPIGGSADLWFTPLDWTPDGAYVLAQADQNGRGPLFLIDAETGEAHQLTDDEATYSSAHAAPNGEAIFAVRSSYAYPNEVVRVDRYTGEVTRLQNPVERPALPGRLTEIETLADDDTRLRAWLALPENAETEPAPLLLWIHGGPLNSWNAWSWRWNPWLMVARGYAVLLPDPALSTGYGQEFIQRGWGSWGGHPYTDLMSITDAAEARDDIDASRTAAMGGSFGGYMANWVAGHTDRFDAIVTHASLWALDNFSGTTDSPFLWRRQFTDEAALEHSPHRFVEQIVTPMLVIHGDKDYRVPINEGNRLWNDLLHRSGLAVDADGRTPHRYLYFPHENHWILSPQHTALWYEVILAFLAEHVLGETPRMPAELGLSGGR
ncbi:S9 family peptidase [Nesterenkonia aerolata]|uniref:Prolyl oligopeptidase family serine peptidase n=1 Tax=Nesterenkonia aerolata TaxID=3074079 RepID=A0ABU2DP42_9MICC|nr:alpha/beta fold hydrolase [Nesterenkonia sp. LY-0111]MDR8018085.1 prolyl oligopeptidase family serine peptidase [Nesterenkonia sp. LY-0111]